MEEGYEVDPDIGWKKEIKEVRGWEDLNHWKVEDRDDYKKKNK